MYFFGYLLMAVANIINIILLLFMWIIIARAILSWVSPDPFNPIVRFIHNVTEPVLSPIRAKFPLGLGGIDLAPILVILAVIFVRTFLVKSLMRFSTSLL